MKPNLLKILTYFVLLFSLNVHAQSIWEESFSVPDKGVWGDENSQSIITDFEGINTWTLNYTNVSLTDAYDYAKTVTTSGGRFECRDINAEITWYSEPVNISEYKNVSLRLFTGETGNGANEDTKYIRIFYKIDDDELIFLDENTGNWGQDTISKTGLDGQTLQLVVIIRNDYASDKIYFDEVLVKGEEKNPVTIEANEILINEVLFNPVPGGEDYVEIYNNSEKTIPLNKLFLASRDKELELTQIYSLTSQKLFLEPLAYLALTKDTNAVFPWYTIECPECFIQMDKFPSYNNDEDFVVLLNNELEVIDELAYNEKMHLSVFQDREGVSLERISFTEATNNPQNWHSASALSGFGTPGYRNSQAAPELPEKISVHFEPESFSPNNDGYNDFYQIHIQTDQPGYLCTIRIFDASGNHVYTLVQNSLIGTYEEISWNGNNESGRRLPLGAYIVLVELYNLQGIVKHFKDAVILTDVLE